MFARCWHVLLFSSRTAQDCPRGHQGTPKHIWQNSRNRQFDEDPLGFSEPLVRRALTRRSTEPQVTRTPIRVSGTPWFDAERPKPPPTPRLQPTPPFLLLVDPSSLSNASKTLTIRSPQDPFRQQRPTQTTRAHQNGKSTVPGTVTHHLHKGSADVA